MDETTWPDALPPYEELRAAWGRDAAVWKGRCPATPPFIVPDLDLIVRDGRARHPQVSVLRDGMPAALSDYTTTRSINGNDVAGFIDPAAVRRLLAEGGSLHLNDLQNVHGGIGALCDALTGHVGRPFSAMAFLSPPGRSAFVLHRDPLHVVVLQTLTAEVPVGWFDAVEDGADTLRTVSRTVADRFASTDWEKVLRDAATRPDGMTGSLVDLVEIPDAGSPSGDLA